MTNPPTVTVKGSISNLKKFNKKTEKERTNSSCFFVSINTNQRYAENDPHLQNDAHFFESKLTHVLHHLKDFTTYPDGDWTRDKIISANVDYAVEMGERHMLHGHALIKLRHKSRVQVDAQKIRNYLKAELGTNCYVNVKFVKYYRQEVNFLDYIDKFKKSS